MANLLDVLKRKMIRVVTIFVLSIFFNVAVAQVVNDEIAERLELRVDQLPLSSTTTHSTVEVSCINRNLTSACLIYHNDQWFTFSSPADGRYYLNISNQKCGKKLGIQILLIEGDPCLIRSYKIRQCISKLPQDDTYVILDSLKQGTSYLLNIDGFLGDQCLFDVQISTQPLGLPLMNYVNDSLTNELDLRDSIIRFSWHVNDLIEHRISAFHVYKKFLNQPKSQLVSISPNRGNAYGNFKKEYIVYDTLHEKGEYNYRIFGMESDTRELIFFGERAIKYYGEVSSDTKYVTEISAKFARGSTISVRVRYPPSGKILDDYKENMAQNSNLIRVDLAKYIRAGYLDLVLILSEEKSRRKYSYFYRAKSDGLVMMQE